MIINIIIALLAFFLAGVINFEHPGFPAFFIWCLILFFIAGVGYNYASTPDGRNRWIF